jgi:hypothetical protein
MYNIKAKFKKKIDMCKIFLKIFDFKSFTHTDGGITTFFRNLQRKRARSEIVLKDICVRARSYS